MSIADKLTRLNTTKQDIKDAIEAQGRDLTNKTFEDDYAAEIAAIEGGGALEITGQEVVLAEYADNIEAFDTVGLYYENNLTPSTQSFSVSGNGFDVATSENFVAVATTSSPFLFIAKRTLDTFSSVTIDINPVSTRYSVSISSSENYIATSGVGINDQLSIYKRDNDN
jgi:hypothetical protein